MQTTTTRIAYRRTLFFLFLVMVFPEGRVLGQQIAIVDRLSGKPIEGVVVTSGNRAVQSDPEGWVILDLFPETSTLVFRHPSYQVYKTSRQRIRETGLTVKLDESPLKLHEIVVSVNRYEQSGADIPQKVDRIGQEEISRQHLPTMAEVAGLSAEVFVQKSQQGGGSPMMRGFSANRLLLVVDGIRMNNALFRSGNLQNIVSVDTWSLESIEVIPGPGTVIYGSDALGGVLSMSTLKPRLSTGSLPVWDNFFVVRTSSASREKTAHLRGSTGNSRWGFLVNGTLQDFGDLKMGTKGPEEYLRKEYVFGKPFSGRDSIVVNPTPERQIHSGYHQVNLMSKGRFKPSDRLDLNAGAIFSRMSEVPRYDRLIVTRNNHLRYGEWYYGPQIWSLFSLSADYASHHPLADGITLIIAMQQYRESRNDRNFNDSLLYRRKEKVNVYTLNMDFRKQLEKKATLAYGLEASMNVIRSHGQMVNLLSDHRQEIVPRYPDQSTYRTVASYLSSRYNLTSDLFFQAGIRSTCTWSDGNFPYRLYQFPFESFNNRSFAVNGNAGLVYHPTPLWQVNLLASSGFRAPNMDDMAKVFDSAPGNVVVPNPGLKPEYARNLEARILNRFGNKLKMETVVFYTHLKNAMVRRPFTFNGQDSVLYNGILSKVEALVNTGFANVYGGTAELEYLPATFLKVTHSFTLIRGFDSDRTPMRHVPPVYGHSAVRFVRNNWFAEILARYNGAVPFDRLSSEERDKPYLYIPDKNGNPYSPGWFILDLRASVTLLRNMNLSAGTGNLFNRRYRPYSSGIAAPGRDWLISLSGRF